MGRTWRRQCSACRQSLRRRRAHVSSVRPESFTPDLLPSSARRPSWQLLRRRGLESIGILTGGGMGRASRAFDRDGEPDVDVSVPSTSIVSTRIRSNTGSPPPHPHRGVARDGVPVPLPTRSMQTARGAERCPPYTTGLPRVPHFQGRERLGRCRLVRVRPHWPVEQASFGASRLVPAWRGGARAAREGVIVMDMSFMSKFLVAGPRRGPPPRSPLRQRTSTAHEGSSVHAVAERGWQAPGGPHRDQARRRALLGRRVGHRAPARGDVDGGTHPETAHAYVADVTSGYAQSQRAGPALARAARSRSPPPTSSQRGVSVPRGARDRHRLRPRAVRRHHVPRRARLRALRADGAGRTHVYDGMVAAGKPFGLRHAGLKALASLRMEEEAYRDYGHDIDNTDTVLEAGLGFAVDSRRAGRLHRPRGGARAAGGGCAARGSCRCW